MLFHRQNEETKIQLNKKSNDTRSIIKVSFLLLYMKLNINLVDVGGPERNRGQLGLYRWRSSPGATKALRPTRAPVIKRDLWSNNEKVRYYVIHPKRACTCNYLHFSSYGLLIIIREVFNRRNVESLEWRVRRSCKNFMRFLCFTVVRLLIIKLSTVIRCKWMLLCCKWQVLKNGQYLQ